MTNRHAPRRIVLVGLPGAGKSAVARQVARRLGSPWRWHDTDELIVAGNGRTIPQIFRESGEDEFRRLEQQAIAHLDGHEHAVIATGGGAVLNAYNRAQLWRNSLVIYLQARPETLAQRVSAHRDAGEDRPKLQGDVLQRLRELANERGPLYALADYTVQTDALFPDQVAELVVHAHQRLGEQLVAAPGRELAWQDELDEEDGPAATVRAPSGSYGIFIGPGELGRLGDRMRDGGLKGRPVVVADKAVATLYAEPALAALRAAGFEPGLITIDGGEEHKQLAAVARVYDRLVERRSERGDPIVALGGGVTTDLAGFVAATYLRGVPLVHVPTSLLCMVDASIGGKVGVDHIQGKNLVGAFYQPRLVVADTDVLATLPKREITAGWAEVIKHALIMDPGLLDTLERDAGRIVALEPEALTSVLRRSAQLKAKVVSGDERESGPRMTLNYGHTIGHAIEAATGYSAVLHGEAVSVGMQGAARIAVELGVLPVDVAQRQQQVLQRYGLPLRWPGVDVDAVLRAMKLDKKVSASRQRWILLNGVGSTIIRDDVPAALVERVVADLLRT